MRHREEVIRSASNTSRMQRVVYHCWHSVFVLDTQSSITSNDQQLPHVGRAMYCLLYQQQLVVSHLKGRFGRWLFPLISCQGKLSYILINNFRNCLCFRMVLIYVYQHYNYSKAGNKLVYIRSILMLIENFALIILTYYDSTHDYSK